MCLFSSAQVFSPQVVGTSGILEAKWLNWNPFPQTPTFEYPVALLPPMRLAQALPHHRHRMINSTYFSSSFSLSPSMDPVFQPIYFPYCPNTPCTFLVHMPLFLQLILPVTHLLPLSKLSKISRAQVQCYPPCPPKGFLRLERGCELWLSSTTWM